MTLKTEGARALGFVLSEDQYRSRETANVASGAGVVAAGMVLGEFASKSAASAAKSGGNTGNGTLTLDAVTPVRSYAQLGVYTARCVVAAVNGGTFRVEDPEGNVIGEVAVGATFDDDIKFVIADGATDFVVGDGFDITVTKAAGGVKYKPCDPTAVDGSERAAAILGYEVDATSADAECVVVAREAAVKGSDLKYHANLDTTAERNLAHAQLAERGIIVR